MSIKKEVLEGFISDNKLPISIADTRINFDVNGDYINPGKIRTDENGKELPTPYTERRAYNNLKRTLLRKLLETYKPDDPVIQKIMEEMP